MVHFTEKERALARQIIDTARELERRGLNQGTAGNLSVRVGPSSGDGFLITPTAVRYDAMQPEDMVRMSLDGTWAGRKPPSSEWRFHRDIYVSRPEAGAVIHTHSGHATTVASLGREIPAFHYMVALFGGSSIRCCPYATYGTQELSNHVIEALRGRAATLMGNHGLVVLGPNLARALYLTVEAETLSMMYLRALQTGEKINILPDDEIERVRVKFSSYGQAEGGPKKRVWD